MRVIKPFGPTIGITKLTKITVTKLNSFSEKVVGSSDLTKKYDFDSQLIGSMKQQFRVPQKVLKSGIENIIKNKQAIYDLKVDKTVNKVGNGSKLEKFDRKRLPIYLQENINKYNEWID